jgi:hypothetical protein
MPYASIEELKETLAADPSSLDLEWSDLVGQFFIAEDSESLQELRRDGIETMDLLFDDFRMGRGASEALLVARMIGRMSDVQVRDYALGVHSEDNQLK